MKVLFKKLQKSNKVLLTIFLFTSLFYLVSLIVFIKYLMSLNGIETILRIVFSISFSIWLIVYGILSLVNLILKRHKTMIVTFIITIVLSIFFIVGSVVINKIYSNLNRMTSSKYTVYTSNLIALNETTLIDNSVFGMIQNEDDIEGHILAKELLKKEKLNNEIIYFDDYESMLFALYNHEIDALFISNNYVILFSSEENYANIANETKVIYEYSKKMKSLENMETSNKKLTEPFTVLVMGVDSESDGLNANAAFNGDTLMLITFNPKTLTATMFSIPRDTYVPIACNHNAYAKINSSAAYGTNCVIDTIEQFVDIKIDYYAKINFRGVIQLVDSLGGIEVDVPMDFCESNSYRSLAQKDLICLKKGVQTLNGEQALALSRHRKTLPRGDIDRTQNQQKVIEAIAKKTLNLKSFKSVENTLNAVSNNIATNLSTDQILSFYNILKDMIGNSLNGEDFITIHKTYLEYYSLPVYLPGASMYTSAIGHYPGSLEAIQKLMKVNLELEEKEPIKTFSYNFGEKYEAGVTGKNITTGNKLQLVPDFTGYDSDYVYSWGSANGVQISVNGNYGVVVGQSIHEGTLLRNVSSITIQLSE